MSEFLRTTVKPLNTEENRAEKWRKKRERDQVLMTYFEPLD